jgi:hypothetical protein
MAKGKAMKTSTTIALLTAVALTLASCGTGAARPAASEFGLGPRASAEGLYIATLQPGTSLQPRKMQTIEVSIKDAAGKPVDGASITVDGGMPEHGHGLPTQPRVTRSLGDGGYEIGGVRFNMGGWWELKLAIETASGTDTVTFNLQL